MSHGVADGSFLRKKKKHNPTMEAVPGYTLINVLGQGSFGCVFKARHELTGKECAIKVAKPKHYHKEAIEREIVILRAMTRGASGCVPALLDSGQLEDKAGCKRVWMATELAENGDLYHLMKRRVKTLPKGEPLFTDLEILRVASTVLTVLMSTPFAFRIHGDLKLENIVMYANGTFRVIDMGLSEFMGGLAQWRELGTPGFSPPESIMYREYMVDRTADIWMLGATLYELAVERVMVKKGHDDRFGSEEYIRRLMLVMGPPEERMVCDPARLRPNLRRLFGKKEVTINRRSLDSDIDKRGAKVKALIYRCCQWDPAARANLNDLFRVTIE